MLRDRRQHAFTTLQPLLTSYIERNMLTARISPDWQVCYVGYLSILTYILSWWCNYVTFQNYVNLIRLSFNSSICCDVKKIGSCSTHLQLTKNVFGYQITGFSLMGQSWLTTSINLFYVVTIDSGSLLRSDQLFMCLHKRQVLWWHLVVEVLLKERKHKPRL